MVGGKNKEDLVAMLNQYLLDKPFPVIMPIIEEQEDVQENIVQVQQVVAFPAVN